MAKKEKQPVHKVVMTEGKREIIRQLLQEYDIETAEDIQDALKDLLGGTIREMMDAECTNTFSFVMPMQIFLKTSSPPFHLFQSPLEFFLPDSLHRLFCAIILSENHFSKTGNNRIVPAASFSAEK